MARVKWSGFIHKQSTLNGTSKLVTQKLSENNKEIKIMLDPQVQIELLKRTWDLAAIEASQYEDRSVQRERFIDVFDKTYTTLATILNKPLNS